MINRVFKNGRIARRAREALLVDQLLKETRTHIFPVNIIEPETLSQCLQFSEWIGHCVISFVVNA